MTQSLSVVSLQHHLLIRLLQQRHLLRCRNSSRNICSGCCYRYCLTEPMLQPGAGSSPAKLRPRRALELGDGAARPFRGCPFSARNRDPTLGGLLGGEPLRLSSVAGEFGRRLLGGVRPTAAALRRAPLAGVVTTVATATVADVCEDAAGICPAPPERNSVSAAAPAAMRAPILWPAEPPEDDPLPAPAVRGSGPCVALCRPLCRTGLAVAELQLESLALTSGSSCAPCLLR